MSFSSARVLHLIPVSLGDAPVPSWLPEDVRVLAGQIQTYIVENAKTARAFLKQVGTISALQDITIHTLSRDTSDETIAGWFNALPTDAAIGLVSEAGCPAVADPGAQAVHVAHQLGMRVKPWVGPSSILLGLMASGLSGQQFAFHGYAPVNPGDRAKTLKAWEGQSAAQAQTQMFIETPYRNTPMFATLLTTLKGDTQLCVARSLTTADEYVKTLTVAQWKQRPPPDLDKQPTLFLFLARPHGARSDAGARLDKPRAEGRRSDGFAAAAPKPKPGRPNTGRPSPKKRSGHA